MSKIRITQAEEKGQSNNIFEGYNRNNLSPQGKKLLKEWMKIEALSKNSDVITYIVRRRNREGLPLEYEIIYRLKSIVGIELNKGYDPDSGETPELNGEPRKPIYGTEHHLSISLPANYPSAYGGNPEFKMISDVWHPNIRFSGKFKGRICLNNKDLGVSVGLDERIIRVGKYLQYQIYWANESYPWPEDTTVAQWVREEAEPNNWINMNEGVFCDYSPLTHNERKMTEPQPRAAAPPPEEQKDEDETPPETTIKI